MTSQHDTIRQYDITSELYPTRIRVEQQNSKSISRVQALIIITYMSYLEPIVLAKYLNSEGILNTSKLVKHLSLRANLSDYLDPPS